MRVEDYPAQEPFSPVGARYHEEAMRRGAGISGIDVTYGADPYQGLLICRAEKPSGIVLAMIHGGGCSNASLAAMPEIVAAKIPWVITASTAPQLTDPVNPYGHSKLASEFMLRDIASVSGMRATILRYFNVAGADPKLRTGQRTKQATHLIKIAAEVATGRRSHLDIYGTDYPTEDGTCIRDYIHVMDLARAHELALLRPGKPGETRTYNCGYGTGHSVRQVVDAFGAVLNHALPTRDCERRAGDAPAIACDATKLKRELGWAPAHDKLNTIVETALGWERKLGAS